VTGVSQEQRAGHDDEDVAVPDVDIVGETVQDIGEAGARILPHPEQPPRPAEEPHHREEPEEEYHVGGVRGPQEPGPWGSDDAIRNQPPWGGSPASPMEEGSE